MKNRNEYQRKYQKEWRKKNPEAYKAIVKRYLNSSKARENRRRYIRRLHDKVISLLGGKCIRCGITDERILQINHKKGGGSRDFKKFGARVYIQILHGKRDKNDFEVRCSNCNIIYEYEIGKRTNL